MNPSKLTPEQEADIQKRVDQFKKDFSEICKKNEVDIISVPEFIPTPRGTFEIVVAITIMDKKFAPIKSPIQPQEGIIKS